MTTKTDIQAAFDAWLGQRANDPTLPHGLMRDAFCAGGEAGRADHLRDATKMITAESVLLQILGVIQQYMPPDGLSVADAMQQIISLVDPWPLPGQPAASAEPADPAMSYEHVLSELIDKIVPGLDSGDILRDARQASAALCLRDPVAQEPVAKVVGMQRLENESSRPVPRIVALVDTLSEGAKLYAAPVAAQAQSVVNQQMTTGAQDREDAPSIWNPLTPYGVLVRALRIVAGTTLMEMSEGTGYTPSYLSGIEFGRNPVTDGVIGCTWSFLEDKGIKVPLSVFRKAADRAAKGADHG